MWEQCIDPDINLSVHTYARAMYRVDGVTECVPAYASLLITHRGGSKVSAAIRETVYGFNSEPFDSIDGRLHELPVCYGGNLGPDLDAVSRHCELSPEQVIDLHTHQEYLIYFLGYRPGFGFMGQTDARLEVPRLTSPRSRVPPGSVGLAGRQTGIYPNAAPGGWQLIGSCPLPLLSADPKELTRLRAGDRVRFYEVSVGEYHQLRKHPLPWQAR